MKYKALSLSLLLAGACATTTFAQDNTNYTIPNWNDNIFVSVGGGIHSVYNSGFNKLAPNFNVSLGKLITPTWGVRAQVNGIWQHLCLDNKQYDHNKKYIGANIDGLLNLSTLFAGANPNRFFEVTAFAGPMVSVAKSPSEVVQNENGQRSVAANSENNVHARVGASAGLGLKFNLSKFWAIDVEARGAIAPSIFGNLSSHNKSEGTGMLTAGVTYIFGGKKFTKPSPVEVVKEVPVEVVKEVPTEVVKEVVKEVPATAAAAVFFKINKTEISEEGMVNVKLMAKTMKANPGIKYLISGYADKGTGTEAINQALSEKRAQAVYDALVAEGVNPDQLVKVAKGGTDPMFGKDYLNRVTILEVNE